MDDIDSKTSEFNTIIETYDIESQEIIRNQSEDQQYPDPSAQPSSGLEDQSTAVSGIALTDVFTSTHSMSNVDSFQSEKHKSETPDVPPKTGVLHGRSDAWMKLGLLQSFKGIVASKANGHYNNGCTSFQSGPHIEDITLYRLVKLNHVSLIKATFPDKISLLKDYNSFFRRVDPIDDCIYHAIINGYIEVADYLCSNLGRRYKYNFDLVLRVVGSDQLKMFQLLDAVSHINVDDDIVNCAVRKGRIDFLNWIRECNRFTFSIGYLKEAVKIAVAYRQFEILRWLYETATMLYHPNQLKMNVHLLYNAILYDSLDIVIWLVQYCNVALHRSFRVEVYGLCDPNIFPSVYANAYGRTEIVKYLRSVGL